MLILASVVALILMLMLLLLRLLLLKQVDVIHCDLKPENILLQHAKRSNIKVIDFGSSCRSNNKVQ